MLSDRYVKKEIFTDAARFLDALGRRDERWNPAPGRWIFRGHADARWRLLPLAFRAGVSLSYESPHLTAPRRSREEQIHAEFYLLEGFLRAADRQGLQVAGEPHAMWADWGKIVQDVIRAAGGNDRWPAAALEAPLALAQHHGIPTRLLDFSRDPRVAAYFAAIDAAKWAKGVSQGPPGVTHLGVWALDPGAIDKIWIGRNERLRLIDVPYATNANIRAQAGTFLCLTYFHSRPHDPAAHVPLDILVPTALDNQPEEVWMERFQGRVVMRHLLLNIEEAPRLTRLLADERISGNYLFHGFDGVVRGLREQVLWDQTSYFLPAHNAPTPEN